jgi:hypothetical protein
MAAPIRGAFPALLLALFLLPMPAPLTAQTWEELEEAGAVVESVEIRIGEVFDLEDPREDHALGRLANLVHIRSRESIVAREIIFQAGEPVSAALIRETERNLRALGYTGEAEIVPELRHDGTLRALVVVEDAWSLKGGFKFRYQGTKAEWGINVEEVNLFGFGKTLQFGYEESRERQTLKGGYRDPRLLGSRWQLGGSYADLSDGSRKRFSLRRPFYAMETEWAALASLFAEESSVRLYHLGEEVARIPSDFNEALLGLWKSFPAGRRSVLRVGVEYRVDEAVYGEAVTAEGSVLHPAESSDRDLRGFFLAGQYLEDRHIVLGNMASIGKTEDVNMGWDIRGAAGLFSEAFGGGQEAFAAEIDISRNWKPGPDRLVGVVGGAEGRLSGGRWEETLAILKLVAYDQRFPRQTLAARASFVGGNRLAPENLLYIGADDGLRGYVNEFLAGDRRWVVGLEDRIITDYTFWGLAQLGFTAFFDAGAIRRLDGGDWSRVYADVGGGFRIGNLKSAFGRITLATIAFPLVKGEGVNDYEIYLGNEIPF